MRTVRQGEWTLLLLRAPGLQPIAGGVLLLDLTDNMLWFRLRTDLTDLAPDLALVWDLLEVDLTDKRPRWAGSASCSCFRKKDPIQSQLLTRNRSG
jgi:hypothetical protein